jgi:hypothetical protein
MFRILWNYWRMKHTLCTNIMFLGHYPSSCLYLKILSCLFFKTQIFGDIVFWKIKRTVFLDKDRTMDNIQKYNICTNVPSAQTLNLIYSLHVTQIQEDVCQFIYNVNRKNPIVITFVSRDSSLCSLYRWATSWDGWNSSPDRGKIFSPTPSRPFLGLTKSPI